MKKIYCVFIQRNFDICEQTVKFDHWKFRKIYNIEPHWVKILPYFIFAENECEAEDKYKKMFKNDINKRVIPSCSNWHGHSDGLFDLWISTLDDLDIRNFSDVFQVKEVTNNISISDLKQLMSAEDFKSWWNYSENTTVHEYLADNNINIMEVLGDNNE